MQLYGAGHRNIGALEQQLAIEKQAKKATSATTAPASGEPTAQQWVLGIFAILAVLFFLLVLIFA